jgi:hypothetical protein
MLLCPDAESMQTLPIKETWWDLHFVAQTGAVEGEDVVILGGGGYKNASA